MEIGDNISNQDLSWFVFGIVAGLALTQYLGPIYAVVLEILVIAVIEARRSNLYEEAVDRYGDRVREKLEILYEKSVDFGEKLSDLLFHYGKYVIGAMFFGTIALIIVTPSLPFRGLALAFTTFAMIDWYFNDLRTVQDILFYWPYRPWRIFAVPAAVAVYLVATGQYEAALKLLIDFLQRGVSQ